MYKKVKIRFSGSEWSCFEKRVLKRIYKQQKICHNTNMNFQPTPDNIAIMRHLFSRRLPAEEVALQVGSSIRTAERWRRKFDIEEHDAIPAVDGRMNRVTAYKLSEEQLDQAIEVLDQDPFMAASDIPDLLNMDVTEKTIRKSFKERRGIFNFKAAEKPEAHW